jgi:hypothetical protein
MAEEWIAKHQPIFDRDGGMTLAITRKPDGALVGAISLMDMTKGHQAELGGVLKQEWEWPANQAGY